MLDENAALLVMPGVKAIVLGGKKWAIPPLVVRQNRQLQPIFQRLTGRILWNETPLRLDELNSEDYEDLLNLVRIALTRAYPDVTPDDLENMPIGLSELVGSLLVIMEQSGLYKARESSSGEAEGEASPQTGTAS
jgi:hypothetical protein